MFCKNELINLLFVIFNSCLYRFVNGLNTCARHINTMFEYTLTLRRNNNKNTHTSFVYIAANNNNKNNNILIQSMCH